MNPRSEFVTPTNSSGGGVLDTKCKFHAASSAPAPRGPEPAPSPIRGSGLGGVNGRLDKADCIAAEDGDDIPVAQAVTRTRTAHSAALSAVQRMPGRRSKDGLFII